MPQGDFRILTIDPGSTTTKIGVFRNEEALLVQNVMHPDAEIAAFRGKPVLEQLAFRRESIEKALGKAGEATNGFDAVAGRGGMTRPVTSGTYRVNAAMLHELGECVYGEHASNLGAFLAKEFAERSGCESLIVDPVSVDEWTAVAHISGTALAPRQCFNHALNAKAMARRFAREHSKRYADLRLMVAHMGSGISVSAHAGGRMIDGNLAGQEGPFSPERAGGLQLMGIVRLCFSGKYTERTMWDALIREGGMYSYLGTKDLREVERRIDEGDAQAALVFDAMVYQIAKEMGAMAAVLHGRLDAVILTGGMAHSDRLTEKLREAIGWMGPVTVYPGENELESLAEGALRVLRGEEEARVLR